MPALMPCGRIVCKLPHSGNGIMHGMTTLEGLHTEE